MTIGEVVSTHEAIEKSAEYGCKGCGRNTCIRSHRVAKVGSRCLVCIIDSFKQCYSASEFQS